VLKSEVLLKSMYFQTPLHKAAKIGNVEVLERLWNWAKELQLKPEEIKNEVLLKNKNEETAWHMAAGVGHD
jgi:ankyrin repeat protein